jgi:hypothetical protein
MEGGAGGLAGALPLHPGRNLRFLHLPLRNKPHRENDVILTLLLFWNVDAIKKLCM